MEKNKHIRHYEQFRDEIALKNAGIERKEPNEEFEEDFDEEEEEND